MLLLPSFHSSKKVLALLVCCCLKRHCAVDMHLHAIRMLLRQTCRNTLTTEILGGLERARQVQPLRHPLAAGARQGDNARMLIDTLLISAQCSGSRAINCGEIGGESLSLLGERRL